MTIVKFKGQKTALSGTIPSIGTKAPFFTLTATNLSDVSLSDFPSAYRVIYTAPSLDTAVCLNSTKKFHEEIGKRANTTLLVVSADLPFAQQRACSAHHLSNIHTLSLMHSKDFAKDFGVLIAEGPLQGLCARAVFVLDENDTILYAELVDEITQEPNYEAVLQIVK